MTDVSALSDIVVPAGHASLFALSARLTAIEQALSYQQSQPASSLTFPSLAQPQTPSQPLSFAAKLSEMFQTMAGIENELLHHYYQLYTQYLPLLSSLSLPPSHTLSQSQSAQSLTIKESIIVSSYSDIRALIESLRTIESLYKYIAPPPSLTALTQAKVDSMVAEHQTLAVSVAYLHNATDRFIRCYDALIDRVNEWNVACNAKLTRVELQLTTIEQQRGLRPS